MLIFLFSLNWHVPCWGRYSKVDLREEAGQEGQQSGMVETSAGRMIAEEFGAEYFECSAKTGLMVEEAFVATATKVHWIVLLSHHIIR